MTAPVPLPHFHTVGWPRIAGRGTLVVLAVASAVACRAGNSSPSSRKPGVGQILFSARYYAPAGSHVHSHFHLYTIRSDGSGQRQLTQGTLDDRQPQLSPRGDRVTFVRDTNYELGGHSSVWRLDLATGATRKLEDLAIEDSPEPPRWTADGKSVLVIHHRYRSDDHTDTWIDRIDADSGRSRRLDGETEYLESPRGDRALRSGRQGTRLVDSGGATVARIDSPVDHPQWLDPATLVGVRGSETNVAVVWIDRNGKQLRERKLSDRELNGRVDAVLPGPDPASVLLAVDRSNSTVRPAYEYLRLDVATGKTRSFTEGQFLAWGPGRDRFCTAPPRDLETYQKLSGNRERSVWTAPLQVGSAKDGKPRTITPGLVWVVGATWMR